tara:strand:+ start:263 stop:703 length:441 start_codon:yes stop_codon:yes gene_type:complete
MAHFAKISDTSQVLGVHVVNNSDTLNADDVEDESVGQQYLQKHSNWPAEMWIQTSYNTRNNTHISGDNSKAFRGNYAGIGYEWDSGNNIFWPPKPYVSWVKDTSDAQWHSPIGDAPDDLTDEEKEAATHYIWNEDNKSWDKKIFVS